MLLGIDEVGRGPIAGPLLVGAVILGDATAEKWQNLKDSKKLSRKKRKELSDIIKKDAVACGIGWVFAEELDRLGIIGALELATLRAIKEATKISKPTEIIIDGNINFLKGTEYEGITTTCIKGDDKIKEISAASIIAKVAHDEYMFELSKKYPEYGFESHVGYGTKKHMEALSQYGPTPEHRFMMRPVKESAMNHPEILELYESRLKNQIEDTVSARQKSGLEAKENGQLAEQNVVKYLENLGHTILAKNYKTKYYEIDIVSADEKHLYFTEVKYRKFADPREAITKEKLDKMTFAAELFTKNLTKKLNRLPETIPSPILAAASVIGPRHDKIDWFPLD